MADAPTGTAVEVHAAGALEQVTQRFTDEQLEVMKRTIAKGASDDEFVIFIALAERYQLDPFAKEIFCIKNERRPDDPAQIMTSRDGYLAIANRTKSYDGLQSDVIREGDSFERTPEGGVAHGYAQTGRGKVVGAYALVYRKDRGRPTYFFAPWNEYGEPNVKPRQNHAEKYSPWFNYPSAMILKVAEAMALKRAFSISGLVGEEELDAEAAAEASLDERREVHARMNKPGRPASPLATSPPPADQEPPHESSAVSTPAADDEPTADGDASDSRLWSPDDEPDEPIEGEVIPD